MQLIRAQTGVDMASSGTFTWKRDEQNKDTTEMQVDYYSLDEINMLKLRKITYLLSVVLKCYIHKKNKRRKKGENLLLELLRVLS